MWIKVSIYTFFYVFYIKLFGEEELLTFSLVLISWRVATLHKCQNKFINLLRNKNIFNKYIIVFFCSSHYSVMGRTTPRLTMLWLYASFPGSLPPAFPILHNGTKRYVRVLAFKLNFNLNINLIYHIIQRIMRFSI